MNGWFQEVRRALPKDKLERKRAMLHAPAKPGYGANRRQHETLGHRLPSSAPRNPDHRGPRGQLCTGPTRGESRSHTGVAL